MRSRPRPEAARVAGARWFALLACAFALWASQALALVHSVAIDEHGHAHHGELFAHHDDDPAQCRLIDQLAHDAPLPPVPSLPALTVAPPRFAVQPASQPAGPAAEGYLARAPPLRSRAS